MHIGHIKLLTSHLTEQKAFYIKKLGLELENETESEIVIHAGETRLIFRQVERKIEPYYHFAFNISENKLLEAKAWIAERNIDLSQDNPNNFHLKSWNSHAIYFYDPAGNIVEFIARHSLPTARPGPFSAQDILYISEIGLVTDNVRAMVEDLQKAYGVEIYKGGISQEFAALGDEYGLFILSKTGRLWLSSNKEAHIYATEVKIEGDSQKTQEFPNMPYRIEMGGAREQL